MKLQGDTETNCCIVGGIAGAYVGIHKIDKAKTRKVLECDLQEQRRPSVRSARRPNFVQPAMGCIDEMIKLMRISPCELEGVPKYVPQDLTFE